MTIKQQVEAIVIHPFFKMAMIKAGDGDLSDIKHLMFELSYHTHEKSNLNCDRTYGSMRWQNTCKIKEEIRNTAPPRNLDLRLATPDRKYKALIKKLESLPVVKKPIVHMKKVVTNNCYQLKIEFQQIA